MNSYLEGSHVFVSDSAAEDVIRINMEDGDLRSAYEMARLFGANDRQARLVALGQDPDDPKAFPQPIGWYKIRPEYGEIFCHNYELES